MAITEVYVDPSIAGDSGTGTIGDPYGDLEYAIRQTTFDTTNGTRVNIKAGTDEVLAATLTTAMADTVTTPAWVPAAAAPLVFQGYTSAAGDGGIGGISGGGSVSIISDVNVDYVYFVDLHLHNVGANNIITFDNSCGVVNCELNNGTAIGVFGGLNCYYADNYIYNVGTTALFAGTATITRNHIADGANAMTLGIQTQANGSITHNIIELNSGSANAIEAGSGTQVSNNSIFSDGGTGKGIYITNGLWPGEIANNLIEGFSGTGGVGIDLSATNAAVGLVGGNSIYNCATEVTAVTKAIFKSLGNESLSASPFTNAATGDYSPVDTGSIKEGSLPQIIGGGLV